MSFPWKKDPELLAEAKELFKNKLYENEAIFIFGFQLGKMAKDFDVDSLNLIFRSPKVSPDAILFREDTNEVMNVEFEVTDSDFEYKMKHDPSKCDLIVCRKKDKEWKNPIAVYELSTMKVYKPQKQIEK